LRARAPLLHNRRMTLPRPFPRALRAAVLPAAFVAVFISALSLSSCGGKSAEGKRYDFKGKVVAVDRAKGEVTVEHEDVKGYMPAMTMPFPIRDADALKTLEAGDGIQATLVVTDDAYWLEGAAITRTLPGGGGAASNAASPGASEPQPGAQVPDVKLVNQDDKPVNIARLKGRALAVSFIYTRCPLPDFCPLMSANFAELNGALASDAELAKRAHLLTVTLDPEFDKPDVLKRYGSAYAGGKFDTWDFATGDPAEVRRLAEFFGLTYKAEGGQVIHSLRTAVLTPDGKLYKLYRGNDWKPSEVLNDLKSAAEK
jgi:protein SCO1